MTDFISYYWNPRLLVDPRLADAFVRMRDDALTVADRASAMATLLDSSDGVAEGLAFDWAFYEISRMRFGLPNPFESHARRLLERARQQLARPPVASVRWDGRAFEAANHAGALLVLSRLGESEDLDLAAAALPSAADSEVFFSACYAVQHCLSLGARPSASMLERLAEVARNPRREEELRLAAIDVIGDFSGDEAVAELVQLAEDGPLRVTIQSAWNLAKRRIPELRPLLEHWIACWPPDAPYPASDVREMLAEQEDVVVATEDCPDGEAAK